MDAYAELSVYRTGNSNRTNHPINGGRIIAENNRTTWSLIWCRCRCRSTRSRRCNFRFRSCFLCRWHHWNTNSKQCTKSAIQRYQRWRMVTKYIPISKSHCLERSLRVLTKWVNTYAAFATLWNCNHVIECSYPESKQVVIIGLPCSDWHTTRCFSVHLGTLHWSVVATTQL